MDASGTWQQYPGRVTAGRRLGRVGSTGHPNRTSTARAVCSDERLRRSELACPRAAISSVIVSNGPVMTSGLGAPNGRLAWHTGVRISCAPWSNCSPQPASGRLWPVDCLQRAGQPGIEKWRPVVLLFLVLGILRARRLRAACNLSNTSSRSGGHGGLVLILLDGGLNTSMAAIRGASSRPPPGLVRRGGHRLPWSTCLPTDGIDLAEAPCWGPWSPPPTRRPVFACCGEGTCGWPGHRHHHRAGIGIKRPMAVI